MSLLNTILGADNGALVQQLGNKVGLDQQQAQQAVSALMPALQRALSKQGGSEGGAAALLGALEGGNHQRYLSNPGLLAEAAGIQDGNAILGHLLGSKDVSRNVAGHAAKSTGIDPQLLKQLLPMVASLAMGALGREGQSRGVSAASPAGTSAGGGLGAMLGDFLDQDDDGSVADDLLNLAKKFF